MLDFLDSEGSACQRYKVRKSRRTIADATEEYSDLGSMRVVVIASPPPLGPYHSYRMRMVDSRTLVTATRPRLGSYCLTGS